MSSRSRHKSYDRYRTRISNLFTIYSQDPNTESQAHYAKYLAVLVSGYLEQAIKELLLEYSSQRAGPDISSYIEKTWPISRNMKTQNIKETLCHFNESWGNEFTNWLAQKDDRKGNINSIIEWRNSIAHGKESNTTGVTIVSVKTAFSTIVDLVSYIENMLKR